MLLLLFISVISAQGSSSLEVCEAKKKACAAQLREDKADIQAWTDLHTKQVDAINEFIASGPETSLKFDGTDYVLTTKSEIQVWDKDANGKIVPFKKAAIEKVEKYSFKIDDGRPHGYIGNVFKFAGGFFYEQNSKKITPDAMLMYEFFSFDLLFTKFQGLSFNAAVGLMHVGGTVGYQFVKTQWFRNTSLNFGYSFNFINQTTEPFIALALNF